MSNETGKPSGFALKLCQTRLNQAIDLAWTIPDDLPTVQQEVWKQVALLERKHAHALDLYNQAFAEYHDIEQVYVVPNHPF